MRTFAVYFLLLTLGPEVFGRSAQSVNPVAGVKLAKVEIAIGGPMTREPSGALELFGGNISRSDSFVKALRVAIAKRFNASGIAISPEAQHTLVLQFYGRPVDPAARDGEYVVLIEASFHDERKMRDPTYCGGSIEVWGRSLLEIPNDLSIEETLQSAVASLLGDLLRRGTAVETQ